MPDALLYTKYNHMLSDVIMWTHTQKVNFNRGVAYAAMSLEVHNYIATLALVLCCYGSPIHLWFSWAHTLGGWSQEVSVNQHN